MTSDFGISSTFNPVLENVSTEFIATTFVGMATEIPEASNSEPRRPNKASNVYALGVAVVIIASTDRPSGHPPRWIFTAISLYAQHKDVRVEAVTDSGK